MDMHVGRAKTKMFIEKQGGGNHAGSGWFIVIEWRMGSLPEIVSLIMLGEPRYLWVSYF